MPNTIVDVERPGEEIWRVWEAKIKDNFPRAKAMTTEELATKLANDDTILVLDVRGEPEHKISKLHATAIRFDDGSGSLDEIQRLMHEKNKNTVVCYCSIGYRSSKLAQRIVDSGQFDSIGVYNLQGGLFQWANDKRELVCVDAEGNVIKAEGAHPYNATFGQMLAPELHKYPDGGEWWYCVVS